MAWAEEKQGWLVTFEGLNGDWLLLKKGEDGDCWVGCGGADREKKKWVERRKRKEEKREKRSVEIKF